MSFLSAMTMLAQQARDPVSCLVSTYETNLSEPLLLSPLNVHGSDTSNPVHNVHSSTLVAGSTAPFRGRLAPGPREVQNDELQRLLDHGANQGSSPCNLHAQPARHGVRQHGQAAGTGDVARLGAPVMHPCTCTCTCTSSIGRSRGGTQGTAWIHPPHSTVQMRECAHPPQHSVHAPHAAHAPMCSACGGHSLPLIPPLYPTQGSCAMAGPTAHTTTAVTAHDDSAGLHNNRGGSSRQGHSGADGQHCTALQLQPRLQQGARLGVTARQTHRVWPTPPPHPPHSAGNACLQVQGSTAPGSAGTCSVQGCGGEWEVCVRVRAAAAAYDAAVAEGRARARAAGLRHTAYAQVRRAHANGAAAAELQARDAAARARAHPTGHAPLGTRRLTAVVPLGSLRYGTMYHAMPD